MELCARLREVLPDPAKGIGPHARPYMDAPLEWTTAVSRLELIARLLDWYCDRYCGWCGDWPARIKSELAQRQAKAEQLAGQVVRQFLCERVRFLETLDPEAPLPPMPEHLRALQMQAGLATLGAFLANPDNIKQHDLPLIPHPMLAGRHPQNWRDVAVVAYDTLRAFLPMPKAKEGMFRAVWSLMPDLTGDEPARKTVRRILVSHPLVTRKGKEQH